MLRIHLNTVIILLFTLTPSLVFSENTIGGGGYYRQKIQPDRRGPTKAAAIESKILCAMKNAGIEDGPTNQWSRAMYVAKHLADVIPRLVPEWKDSVIAHLVSQSLTETGTLKDVTEVPNEYASSASTYKGRGIIQLTLLDNYTFFAGCEEAIDRAGKLGQIERKSIAGARSINSSDIVRNPSAAFSESTEKGQRRNVLTSICWMVRTQEKHKAFANALECVSDECIDQVGVAINRGPGALGSGKKPLASQARRNMFRKIESCFDIEET